MKARARWWLRGSRVPRLSAHGEAAPVHAQRRARWHPCEGSMNVEPLLGPEGGQSARSAQHTETDRAGALTLHKCVDLD